MAQPPALPCHDIRFQVIRRKAQRSSAAVPRVQSPYCSPDCDFR